MIHIDGGLGGGQLLRTALSLSAATGKSFEITNIRGKREEGGLKNQHLAVVRAVKELCNGKVKGDFLGSKNIVFEPREINARDFSIDIGTAGSTMLVLQTVIPAIIHHGKEVSVNVKGGTDTKWCPPSMYFKNVFCDFLKKIGLEFEFKTRKYGFYPKGGGEVCFVFKKGNLVDDACFLDRGKLKSVNVHAVASNHLKGKKVAERMVEGFKESFSDANFKMDYVDTLNAGGFIHCNVEYENYKVGDDALCEAGKRAEDVGKECAEKIVRLMKADGLDMYMSDQILIYMGLIGKGEIKVMRANNHVKTNIEVIEKFLPIKFAVQNDLIRCELR